MSALHQQINLYQPVFRKQEKVFGSVRLLQISAAALLLLLMILAHAHWTLADMQHSAQRLQRQVESLDRQLAGMQTGDAQTGSTPLADEVAALRDRIVQRNDLMSQFERLNERRSSGFATRFEALAGLHVPGLWLESVNVDSEARIELRGIALSARLVPHYVQELERNRRLSKRSFETVSMTRMDSDAPQLQFVLRNFKGETAWQ